MKVKNRVKKYDEFQKVINFGENIRSSTLTLYFIDNDLGYTRIGISVPKKSGNAVVRNKIKRQIRAILSKECNFNKSVDFVLIARKEFNIDDFQKTYSDIKELLNKVGNNSEKNI